MKSEGGATSDRDGGSWKFYAGKPFDLQRFASAQAFSFETTLAELRAGRKRGHWMWYIFPQLRGLGRSSTTQFYGISSLDEGRMYLSHPVLGPRLKLSTRAVLSTKKLSVREIFGSPDDMKFHSSMTPFSIASSDGTERFKKLSIAGLGAMDEASLKLLDPRPS
jgi:uncharacterized protein (DUF1810 family)